jgi:hypothetical protein
MTFTIKQEAMGVISALISILGTEVISPLAPELLLGQFSGWVWGLAAMTRNSVAKENLHSG